jgi:UDP-N-acetylmuramoyl-L-alanyl-D-glutamate--2,6-diaminopimelate ligase
MRIPFAYQGYHALTDNTAELDGETLFLKTIQNSPYYERLDEKPAYISPEELSKRWGLEALQVVGITGTNGKTTTAALLYSLLNDLGAPSGLQGTRGFFAREERLDPKSMTTPSVLETMHNMHRALAQGCTHFVMEVSSHAIDQDRIEGIVFALKIHTNVTSDHLDYHGTIEEYRQVKSRFFSDESPKLLNKDDISHIEYNPKNSYSYGVDAPATFSVIAYTLRGGITAGIRYFNEEATFHSQLMGFFNLFNLMAAISAAKILTDKPLETVCEVVENFAGVSGRMEVVSRDPMVIVDFAHTEDGIRNVLESLKDQEISVVFGAGGDRDRSKRPRMGAEAGRYANHIFVTSDNPRSENPIQIIEEILVGLRGKENVTAVPDRHQAIMLAMEMLSPGEVLVILGKGDEEYQEIKGIKYPFDDRKVVREILAQDDAQRK